MSPHEVMSEVGIGGKLETRSPVCPVKDHLSLVLNLQTTKIFLLSSLIHLLKFSKQVETKNKISVIDTSQQVPLELTGRSENP